MNVSRIFLGGLVAAVVLFVLTGFVNGALLSADFEGWAREMGSLRNAPSMPVSMGLWALMALAYGMVGVWIYASIRPRYGAGLKTALLAGLFVWSVGKFAVSLDLITLGVLPTKLIVGQVISSLLSLEISIVCGSALYRPGTGD